MLFHHPKYFYRLTPNEGLEHQRELVLLQRSIEVLRDERNKWIKRYEQLDERAEDLLDYNNRLQEQLQQENRLPPMSENVKVLHTMLGVASVVLPAIAVAAFGMRHPFLGISLLVVFLVLREIRYIMETGDLI